MLQKFGLAEHQALTISSPALSAASAGQTSPPQPPCAIYTYAQNYADVPLFIFIFINLRVGAPRMRFYYPNFLSAP